MTSHPLLRVTGPDCLPALVPHLVGFHPSASVVVLGLESGSGRVLVTVRLDLPAAEVAQAVVVEAWSPAAVGLERAGADAAVVAVYPEPHDDPWRDGGGADLPHRRRLEELVDLLAAAQVQVRDVVCVVGDRIASYLCSDPLCCPPEGRLVDASTAALVGATFVEQGSAPLSSRDDLAAQLVSREPGDPFLSAVRRRAPGLAARLPLDPVERVSRFVRSLRGWDGDPRRATTLVRLVATVPHLVDGVPERDLLLQALTAERDRPLLRAARAVLAESVRCAGSADGSDVAVLASVLAVCAWVDGDGAAAWTALDRALAADPGYSLALLVTAALEQVTPPWVWSEMMRDLSADEILGRRAC